MITDKGAVSWGEIEPTASVYLGKKASVASRESAGAMSALKAHSETPEITILTDSMAALSTKSSTSPKGTQPDQASRGR